MMGIFNKLDDWVRGGRDQKAVCEIPIPIEQQIVRKSQNQLFKRKYFLETVGERSRRHLFVKDK